MEELKYKYRSGMIFDLMFRPKRARRKLSWTINGKLREQREELETDFSYKISFLAHDQDIKGIATPKYNMPVLSVSYLHPHNGFFESLFTEPKSEEQILHRNDLEVSFASSDVSAEYMEREAARIIANNLVDKGFLRSSFEGHRIIFSLKTFE